MTSTQSTSAATTIPPIRSHFPVDGETNATDLAPGSRTTA
jgi:hypothetical protein